MNITTIKSALVSGLIVGLLAMGVYIVKIGSIFGLNWHSVINVGVISFLTAVASLLKVGGTNTEGVFLGMVKVK